MSESGACPISYDQLSSPTILSIVYSFSVKDTVEVLSWLEIPYSKLQIFGSFLPMVLM